MTKPIPASKDHRQGSVLPFYKILNKFWYGTFEKLLTDFGNALYVSSLMNCVH